MVLDMLNYDKKVQILWF